MLIDQNKKCLVLRLKDPNRVLSVIPTSKAFKANGKQYVAVKHGPDETKVLRSIGIDAPSPILYHYDWPGTFAPFAAQREAAAFMSLEPRAFNLSDMGTGKTMATLWGYDYLRGAGIVHKALVVTPLSTLERTWADETFSHFPHLTTAVVYGSRAKRLEALEQDVDLYLINHDGIKVPGLLDALALRKDIDLIIIDEIAQVGRNAGTDRWRALQTICNRQVPRRVWGLTGTPTPNQPTDAWAQCRLISPGRVPPYFNRFKDSVMRQINQFLWVPRDNALDTVHEAMQPAIRFARDECIDLPPIIYTTRSAALTDEQQSAYSSMMQKLCLESAEGKITAANEAVKAQKLMQIACLAYNTPVATDRGWVPIQNITIDDLVWDGVSWVGCDGSAYMGDKEVIELAGVRMTPDHKVLSEDGWKTAEEVLHGEPSGKLVREEVWFPDCSETSRHYVGGGEVRPMALRLSVRQPSSEEKPVSPAEVSYAPEKLWVPSRQRDPQDDKHQTISNMDPHATAVLHQGFQRLGELRQEGDNGLRQMEKIVSELLDRHGKRLRPKPDPRPEGQFRELLTIELPVGNAETAGEQQAEQPGDTHPKGENDRGARDAGVQSEADNAVQKIRRGVVGTTRVYDIRNCGPRNRFVVQGKTGEVLIVHNCGDVYDGKGGAVQLDATPRMKVLLEVVEEASSKVIIFVPFVAVIHKIRDFLTKNGVTSEAVYGEVSKNERDRIFSDFQNDKNLDVIVAQPASMSHGLNLQAASTVVWFAPITSNDTFGQANARISRAGQKFNQLIVMIEGTAMERKYYQRLKNKQHVQGILLDMVQESRAFA